MKVFSSSGLDIEFWDMFTVLIISNGQLYHYTCFSLLA